jgi:hypothetical protein
MTQTTPLQEREMRKSTRFCYEKENPIFKDLKHYLKK